MNQKPTTDETFESQSVTPGTGTDKHDKHSARKRNKLLKSMDANQGREMVEGN